MARKFYTDEEWLKMAYLAGFKASPLARAMKLSLRQLQRHTQERFDRSPQALLDEWRLAAAITLLKETRLVKEVAADLGFCDPAHFSHHFKRHYKISPTGYLKVFDAGGGGKIKCPLQTINFRHRQTTNLVNQTFDDKTLYVRYGTQSPSAEAPARFHEPLSRSDGSPSCRAGVPSFHGGSPLWRPEAPSRRH